MSKWTPEYRKEYDRRRYQARSEARRAQIAEQRRMVVDEFNQMKESTPCSDCGQHWPSYVMHWDHLPGFEKLGTISDMVRSGKRQQALAEIKKCELVCGNCHAIRTHNRRQLGVAQSGQSPRLGRELS